MTRSLTGKLEASALPLGYRGGGTNYYEFLDYKNGIFFSPDIRIGNELQLGTFFPDHKKNTIR